MRKKGFVIALALSSAVYLFVVRPLLISEEGRIRKNIKEGVQAIEAKDLRKCLRNVSLHYKDEYGLTYVGVKGLLTRIFQEFDAFEIDLKNLQMTFLDKGVASVTFGLKVKVTYGGQKGYLLGSGHSSNRVKMRFIKEGGKWKVIQAEGIEPHAIGQELPKVVRTWLDNTV